MIITYTHLVSIYRNR